MLVLSNNSELSQHEIIHSDRKTAININMVMVQTRAFILKGNSMNVVKPGNPNAMNVQSLLATAQILT